MDNLVHPFPFVMTEAWTCPICGWKSSRVIDCFDHILKMHSQEYNDLFYSSTRLYERGSRGRNSVARS